MPSPAGLPPLTPNAWLRWDLIEPRVRAAAPRRVLELGAGMGAVGARLAAMADEYVGVEPDATSRRRAAARLPAGTLLVADPTDVPPEPFDLVCAFEVLEHIEDDRAALQSWIRHLRPGGTVLLSVPAYRRRFSAADVMVGHVRRYDPIDLAVVASAAGLVDVEVMTYGGPFGYVLETGRNLVARTRRVDADGRTRAQRTAGSGRQLQPPPAAARAVAAAMVPFRLAQRPLVRTPVGTGLVLVAHRPSAEPPPAAG